MWEKIATLTAVVSAIISLVAIYVSVSGSKSSNEIAAEALKTSRQANDIALGITYEPAVIGFILAERKSFDFTGPEGLSGELKNIVSIENLGKTQVDDVSMELIGIEPLTYPLDDPKSEVRPLPSRFVEIGLKVAIQPGEMAHIDMNFPILEYLDAVSKNIEDKERVYTSAINIVLLPRAAGKALPAGVSSANSKANTNLIYVRFKPSVLLSDQAKSIMETRSIQTRVYPR